MTGATQAGADLDSACAGAGLHPVPGLLGISPSANSAPNDIGKQDYLDDRSTPDEVVRSLYNAVNRHEYARAYSYWGAGSQAQPFPAFQDGYAQTAAVALTTGHSESALHDGDMNYALPVDLSATMTDGSVRGFTRCYRLQLPVPSSQTVPPYQPLNIQSAALRPSSSSPNLDVACNG
ncbi:MAG: hypothetical protein ACREJM_03935 [Candidatus Saccharimonadales bacterium]